ncbi:MAG: hypothetical protein ABSF14_15710, partial [Terriglobia bacterium]
MVIDFPVTQPYLNFLGAFDWTITGCGKTQFGNGIASNEACEEMMRSNQRCSVTSPWSGGFLR